MSPRLSPARRERREPLGCQLRCVRVARPCAWTRFATPALHPRRGRRDNRSSPQQLCEDAENASRRSAGLHRGRNVGGQRAPDRKRRALHQAEIGARAGPIWHYAALRGTRSTPTCSGGGVVPSLPKGCAFLGLGPICTGCSRGDLGQNGGKPGGREARRRETRRHAGPVRLRARHPLLGRGIISPALSSHPRTTWHNIFYLVAEAARFRFLFVEQALLASVR